MSSYNHNQDLLAREIRLTLENFDFSNMSREEVAEVLRKEARDVEFGSVENLHWLEGLEMKSDEQSI